MFHIFTNTLIQTRISKTGVYFMFTCIAIETRCTEASKVFKVHQLTSALMLTWVPVTSITFAKETRIIFILKKKTTILTYNLHKWHLFSAVIKSAKLTNIQVTKDKIWFFMVIEIYEKIKTQCTNVNATSTHDKL